MLCRWAIASSLAQVEQPADYIRGGKSAIEMDWNTFAGKEGQTVYTALLAKLGPDLFYSHLQRGIDLMTLADNPLHVHSEILQ